MLPGLPSKTFVIILFAAIFLCLPFVSQNTRVFANISFGPDTLCISSSNVRSDDFHFLDGVFGDHSYITDYDTENDCLMFSNLFDRPHQLYYKKSASKIKIVLDQETLVSADLEPLKIATKLQAGKDQYLPIEAYECPWHEGQTPEEANTCPLLFNYNNLKKPLSAYDGKHLKIYMDKTVVRDYTMRFAKGDSPAVPVPTPTPSPGGFLSRLLKIITNLFSFSKT